MVAPSEYWLRRYTYWGNLTTWEEYYRNQNHYITIDECYNSLNEDINTLLQVFDKSSNERKKLVKFQKKLQETKKNNKSTKCATSLQLNTDDKYDTDDSEETRKNKCATSLQLNTDDKYDTDDDEILESESSSQNRKRKRRDVAVDFEKYPLLENYCRILLAMQELHIEEDSQRARHSFTMLEWSVVNFEIFAGAGWQIERKPVTISIPQIKLKLLSPIFERHFDCQIRSVTTMLRSLENKGKIGNSSMFSSWVDWLWNPSKSYYKIDVLTYIPVISAVISYIPTPCRGLGSEPSENHIKAELWMNILSNSFSLNNPKFVPVWEYHHLIPGNGGQGSAKSDFAAIVSNQNDLQFAFFLVEFEQGGFEIHKDDVTIVAEATHEFNRILSLMHYPSKDEINKLCLHIGLVNGSRIRLSKLMPVFDQSTLIYVHDDEVLSFNLQTKDEEANIESALQLVVYLRETVCMDGMRIRSLLNRYPAKYNYDLKAALPELPSEAIKSRNSSTKFTPRSKRQRYTLMTAPTQTKDHNTPSPTQTKDRNTPSPTQTEDHNTPSPSPTQTEDHNTPSPSLTQTKDQNTPSPTQPNNPADTQSSDPVPSDALVS